MDEDDLEPIRDTDAELDDIAAGGPGRDDRVARILVAWRDAGRKGEPVTPDYRDAELADLHLRDLENGAIFIGVAETRMPDSLAELDGPPVRTIRGLILNAEQRRELAARLLRVDDV